MRPFRRNSLGEKLLGVVSQLLIFGFSALFCLWMISGARAGELAELISIQSEKISENSVRIEMEFSQEIQADQVSTGFDRDFFQIAIQKSSVFPAKTEKLNNAWIRKAFAYQYHPGLTRARFYLGAKADQVKNALSWEIMGKKIVLLFEGTKIATLPVAAKIPGAVSVPPPAIHDSVPTQAAAVSRSDLTKEEEVLLRSMADRLESKTAKPAQETPTKAAEPKGQQTNAPVAAEQKAESDLFSGMRRDGNRPSAEASSSTTSAGLGKVFFSLVLVLALIGGLGVGFRKIVLKKGFSLGASSKLIKPITSYTLAPGKQITIVRIGDETLVLGVTSSNISLITTLNVEPNEEIDSGTPNTGSKRSAFNHLLEEHLAQQEETSKPVAMSTASRLVEKAFQSLGVREAIKDRVRGFKQLS